MGVVYKIICLDTEIFQEYIGSCLNIISRISTHKSASIQHPDRPVYKFILDNGGWNNWYFLIVDEIEDDDIVVMRTRERAVIDSAIAPLNIAQIGRAHV